MSILVILFSIALLRILIISTSWSTSSSLICIRFYLCVLISIPRCSCTRFRGSWIVFFRFRRHFSRFTSSVNLFITLSWCYCCIRLPSLFSISIWRTSHSWVIIRFYLCTIIRCVLSITCLTTWFLISSFISCCCSTLVTCRFNLCTLIVCFVWLTGRRRITGWFYLSSLCCCSTSCLRRRLSVIFISIIRRWRSFCTGTFRFRCSRFTTSLLTSSYSRLAFCIVSTSISLRCIMTLARSIITWLGY